MSLVELMLGIVAIVTVLGAIVSMILQQSRLRRQNQELYMAYLACVSTMEDIRAMPFSGVPTVNGNGFDVMDLRGNPGGVAPLPGDPDGLPGRITVVLDQSAGAEKLYLVTLDVAWKGAAQEGKFKMRSLLGERKVQ